MRAVADFVFGHIVVAGEVADEGGGVESLEVDEVGARDDLAAQLRVRQVDAGVEHGDAHVGRPLVSACAYRR